LGPEISLLAAGSPAVMMMSLQRCLVRQLQQSLIMPVDNCDLFSFLVFDTNVYIMLSVINTFRSISCPTCTHAAWDCWFQIHFFL